VATNTDSTLIKRVRLEAQLAELALEDAQSELNRKKSQLTVQQFERSLDELATYLQHEREQELQDRIAEVNRKAAQLAQIKALAAQHTTVPVSGADMAAFVADLGRTLDVAWDKEGREIDQAESRRLYDAAFRRAYDRQHPGGYDHCQCDGHRSLRREPR